MEYKSEATLLGLPIVHICSGNMVGAEYRRGTARGWIAIGDTAIGVLLAAGGVACGGIAFGGLASGLVAIGGVSLGALALAGVALGGYCVGGLAAGVIAVGGMAFAGYAAYGGGAIAIHYAFGGLAIARHANDPAAQEVMASGLMRIGKELVTQPAWVWWFFACIFFVPMLIVNWVAKMRPPQ